MPAFEPVRIGVVGAGRFGQVHAATIAGLAESELAALVDVSQAALDAARVNLPAVPCFTDLDRALETVDADAWVVACATASHVPVARRLLERGFPVLLEKPMATSLEEGRALGAVVREDSRNLMLGHVLLFNSELRALLAECQRRAPPRFLSSYRMRSARLLDAYPGENPFRLTMVHDLYCARVLLGGERPEAFTAQRRTAPGGGVDLALAQLRWRDGRLATFTAGFLTPDGMPEEGFDRMEVYGDGWMARLEPNPRPIDVWDHAHAPPLSLEIGPPSWPPTGMLAEELRCFCGVVRGEGAVPPGATFADALEVQAWIEILERAAA